MTSVEQLSALYCSLKVACNSNSKKDKKRHDIALQDVPLCLKLHVIGILRRPLQPFLTQWYMRVK